jgi:hypothetical protein
MRRVSVTKGFGLGFGDFNENRNGSKIGLIMPDANISQPRTYAMSLAAS